ncbi:Fc.00g115800.m01.CDS01 [Cosmosporella sp. VM-42]
MVAINQIRNSNAQVTEETVPKVALFAGGTSGIGKATIGALAGLKLGVKVFVVGRKSAEPSMTIFLNELRSKNPKADLVWVEADISLLTEVKRVTEMVKKVENRLDLLFLTAGYAPFGGRNDTSEGIETTHALEYYGRALFIYRLLPLLRASPSPRVVSVLSGSLLSRRFIANDLNLDKPGAFGGIQTQTQMGTMNTLTLDRLAAAEENSNISFIHNWPGAVDTGNMARYWKRSFWSPIPLTTLLKPLFWVIGISLEESAERHLFMSTSGIFGGKGPRIEGISATDTKGGEGGLYLLNDKCDAKYDHDVLKELRDAAQENVWEKTMEILGPYI